MISIILILFTFSFSTFNCSPLVLDDTSTLCNYKALYSKKREISYSFPSKQYSTSEGEVTAYFNLCDKLPAHICGEDAVACLKDRKGAILLRGNMFNFSISGNKLVKEKKFILIGNSIEISNSTASKKPTFTVIPKCIDSDNIIEDNVKLETANNEYLIHITDPDPECELPDCSTKIYGKILDLRTLMGVEYQVKSDVSNFSISFCGPNPQCGNSSVTACIMTSPPEPLSNFDQERIEYHEKESQVAIHGKYGKLHDFEILLQCNWYLKKPKISYIAPERQGKKYKFKMESEHGCIVRKAKCEYNILENSLYFYNLSNLNKQHGYKVENVSKGSTLLINPCGPLVFKESDNNCTDTYANVCEMNRERYVNKGSVQTQYEINLDYLSMTFLSGVTCKGNSTRQYVTYVTFQCSNSNENPILVNRDECDIYINWETPEACLKPRRDNCKENSVRASDCTATRYGDVYDFSHLAKENSRYIVKDTENPSVSYLINVCAPVIDGDIPCHGGAAVIFKNDAEFDSRKRFKLSGRMKTLSAVDDHFVLKATGGSHCRGFVDYQSSILFICSHEEEGPVITNRTECNLEFTFKTKYACDPPYKCKFRNPYNDYMLDLKQLQLNDLTIVDSNVTYQLEICNNDRLRECSNNNTCVHAEPKRDLFVFENKVYLDFEINQTCTTSNQFNRTLIELVCDPLTQNNDHYNRVGVFNCILYLQLISGLMCTHNKMSANEVQKTKYIITNEDESPKKIGNCTNSEKCASSQSSSSKTIVTDESSNAAIIIGISITAVVVVSLMVAARVFVYRKNRKSEVAYDSVYEKLICNVVRLNLVA